MIFDFSFFFRIGRHSIQVTTDRENIRSPGTVVSQFITTTTRHFLGGRIEIVSRHRTTVQFYHYRKWLRGWVSEHEADRLALQWTDWRVHLYFLLLPWRHSDRVAYALSELLTWHPVKSDRLARGYSMGRRLRVRQFFSRLRSPWSWHAFTVDQVLAT